MRVISGNSKGKKLKTLDTYITRPTSDRVKEAIFDILQFKLKDTVILDLFAGSGALGIEALSRGAKEVIFCDNSYKTIEIIKKNLDATGLSNKARIFNVDYMQMLDKLKLESTIFNITFLDPPYKSDYALNAIQYIIENKLLDKDGIIVVETNSKDKVNEINNYKEIEIYNIRKYGIAYVLFVRKG